MTQQSHRRAVRVLLTVGAPIVVAVFGVSLGVAGGSAQADNGGSIILGADCVGSGTNCETSPTLVENTGNAGLAEGFEVDAQNGSGLVGTTLCSTCGFQVAGVFG